MARMSFAYILSVLMIAVAACSGERGATSTTSSAPGEPRTTVALITHQAPGDTFWDLVRRGAEAAAAKDDFDLQYFHDPDAAAQAELDRSARLDFSQGARIVPAGLGADGPHVGAAAVGWRGLRQPVDTI